MQEYQTIQVFAFIVYLLILIYTVIRILLDTDSTPKTLAYLLLIFIFPLIGILIYFSFGINYRHLQSNSKGATAQLELDKAFQKEIIDETEALIETQHNEIAHFLPMVHLLAGLGNEHLCHGQLKILVNGEEKFPEVLKTLESGEHFIHMEYYDWENDIRGNQIKDILLKKANSGVKVRVLYDDYASRGIKKNIVRELKQGGIKIYPKIKVKLKHFANRVNHRDHRKIIIVDGIYGFVGGINVSDRYDNSIDTGLFWRDTHVKITGRLVNSLQRHFIVSWNASAPEPISLSRALFPKESPKTNQGIPAVGQVVAGGPIYPKSNIMLSYMRIFSLAREKLYITNPYFIPSESIMSVLCQAAIAGVDVRIIVPAKSDSAIVGAASRFYFTELLNAGVRIFLFKKGFVHAKTVVSDSRLSVIGTANMDIRSFDLNFEIMPIIYGMEFAKQLEGVFLDDLTECNEISVEEWKKNSIIKKLIYAIARLISSFL
jgi:cardiolipin synthase